MPALRALLAQFAGTIASSVIALVLARAGWYQVSIFQWALLEGVMAAAAAARMRADRWWLPLHLAFAPAVVLSLALPVPPAIYLTILGILLLVYGLPFRSQVPLFLSSQPAVAALADWLPPGSYSILDVGSGTGRFVTGMARRRADCRVTGIELAWLPWWLSHFATRHLPNASVRRRDFWPHPLGNYDVVYAFLSPVPMPALWDKARRELRSGGWLVSNSFPVPGVTPTATLEVDDRRRTRLFCYRMPDR